MRQFTNQKEVYKLSKNGKIQVHRLATLELPNGEAQLYTQYGYIDGAMQEDIKHFSRGKNIGRANETSALEQALSELNSKLNKLLDKGYKRDNTNGADLLGFLKSQEGTDATGSLKPMLAQKDKDKIKLPGYVQRKYDGVRCFTFIENAQIRKVSRNGKPFQHLGHLDKELKELMDLSPGDLPYKSWIIDGELYSHELSFQQIISAIKREQPSNELIQYRIYDMIPIADMRMGQGYRMKIIRSCRSEFTTSGIFKYLEFSPTLWVRTWAKFQETFSRYIREGFEGIMFRSEDGIYEFGRRSYSLIKYKEFDEGEFEIMGAEEATGRDAGTAVFLLKTESGQWFSARPLGTREERRDYYNKRAEYIGKMGTVKYQGLSDTGIPRFPVFKAIRDYE
jgi:ATP-dependent DNA ligase